MKRSPIKRKTRLLSKTRPKRKKRGAAKFDRIYGSKERVAWVKGQPCCICGGHPCENAHTVTGGMGYKAGYETIVPLCRMHHRMYDEHHWPLSEGLDRWFVQSCAAITEAAWQAYTLQRRTA